MNKSMNMIYGLVISAVVIMALAFTVNAQSFKGVYPTNAPNVTTTFRAIGLPVRGVFKVTYDNITKSTNITSLATTTGSLKFNTSAGNYTFIVYNSSVGNLTYVPSPANGNLTAGSTLNIRFNS